MLTVAVPFGGKLVTVHLHAGGIAAVYDPGSDGWELRKLPAEGPREDVGNVATAYVSDVRVPLSLVGGERIGTGRDIAAGLRNWVRR